MNLNSIVQQLESEQQHQALARPATAASAASAGSTDGSSSSTGGTTGSATITADDFLKLLVSELQNQDPTANTDPNEYVNQLVNVNSLQQLISINQEVGDITPPSSGSGTSSSSVVNALASAPVSPPAAAQTATARVGYTAFGPNVPTASSSPRAATAPANSAGVFDNIASKLTNPALPAGVQPKNIAVH